MHSKTVSKMQHHVLDMITKKKGLVLDVGFGGEGYVFHFVEVQSTFSSYLQNGFQFLSDFCGSDQVSIETF